MKKIVLIIGLLAVAGGASYVVAAPSDKPVAEELKPGEHSVKLKHDLALELENVGVKTALQQSRAEAQLSELQAKLNAAQKPLMDKQVELLKQFHLPEGVKFSVDSDKNILIWHDKPPEKAAADKPAEKPAAAPATAQSASVKK